MDLWEELIWLVDLPIQKSNSPEYRLSLDFELADLSSYVIQW